MSEEVVKPEVPATGTPEQPPVNVATPETGQEGSESTPEDHADPAAEEKRRQRSLEKRINRLVREAAEAKAQLAAERALRQQAPAQGSAGDLDPSQFTDYAQYLEAVAERKVEAKLKERESREQAGRAEQQRIKLLRQGAREFDDFEEVVTSPEVAVTRSMADLIEESEIPHRILYHIASDPELSQEIAGKSPAAQARAILKIEQELMQKKPRESKAPAPISPVSGTAVQMKDPSNMTTEEYVAAKRAGKIKMY